MTTGPPALTRNASIAVGDAEPAFISGPACNANCGGRPRTAKRPAAWSAGTRIQPPERSYPMTRETKPRTKRGEKPKRPGEKLRRTPPPRDSFQVVIQCQNEDEQERLYN